MHNIGKIGVISKNFKENSVTAEHMGFGGGLYNSGNIDKISGDFIENSVSAQTNAFGGGWYNGQAILGQKISILSNPSSAPIYLFVDYTNFQLGFDDPDREMVYAGDVDISNNVFSGNSVIAEDGYALGGGIMNSKFITLYEGAMSQDEVDNMLEAIEPLEEMGMVSTDIRGIQDKTLKLTNVSFLNNSAVSTNHEAKGGGIYSDADLDVVADGDVSLFQGNTANGISSGIYMGSLGYMRYVDDLNDSEYVYNFDEEVLPTLTLNAVNSGTIIMNDDIDGDVGYKVRLTGDSSGVINLNANIFNADISVGDDVVVVNPFARGPAAATIDEVNVAHGDLLNHSNSLHINSGTMNILNLGDTRLHFNKFESNGGILNVLNSEVDLAKQTMGGITADDYVHGDTVINVNKVTVNTDGADLTTNVNFTDNIIGDQVASAITSSTGPVYDYGVEYDATSGDFIFTRAGNNPAVMLPGASAVASAGVLSEEIYSKVLADIDTKDADVVCTRSVAKTFAKAFGTKDSVDLKNFVGADTEYYGLIGGIESGRINEGKGWSASYNMYAAYVHGEQDYGFEEVKQNGGYIGVGGTLYRGDFYAGLTTNIGMLKNKAKTEAGDDKFDTWLGGVALKTGYDFRLENNVRVQPHLYGSYTYVSVEDYTTKGGAKIKFDGIHVFEVAPGLKVSKEFEGKLNAYITGRYVWTFNNNEDVTANNIALPDIDLKSYVEYGVGLEKEWVSHNASAFAQITRRDGGREGWNALIGVKKVF